METYEVPTEVLESIQAQYIEILEKHLKMFEKALIAHLSPKPSSVEFITTHLSSFKDTMAAEVSLIESEYRIRGTRPVTSKRSIADRKVNVPLSDHCIIPSKKTVREAPKKRATPSKSQKPIPSDEKLKDMDRKALEDLLVSRSIDIPDKATLAKIRSTLKKVREGKGFDMSSLKKALPM